MIDANELKWRRWTYDPNDENLTLQLKPKDKIYCPFCKPSWWMFWRWKPIMKPTFGNVFSFDISVEPAKQDKVDREKRQSHAEDVWQTCPKCGYYNVHGVPLSKEEFREIMDFIIAMAEKKGLIRKGERLIEQ